MSVLRSRLLNGAARTPDIPRVTGVSPGAMQSEKATSKEALWKETISWSELPGWMQDNSFIVRGYRREQQSWIRCARSVFEYLHNESVNIHTHLIGGLIFLFLFITTYEHTLSPHPTITWHDAAGFMIFFASAVFCLFSSATYHAASCHSVQVARRCHMFDYTGIVVLTVGSFYPCLYYGFFCDPAALLSYLTLITVAGASAAYIVLSPTYATPTYRWARTAVFIALGLCAILPISHGWYTNGWHRLTVEMGLKWVSLSGALYISGALIYALRIPERWSPGTFDYFFSSHQIFHVNVVLAALAHYVGLRTALHHRHGVHGGLCVE